MVETSVTGLTIQSPVIPNIAGKTNIAISKMTRPLADEIIADSFAYPIDVKYIDAIQLMPANGKAIISIRIPREAILTID